MGKNNNEHVDAVKTLRDELVALTPSYHEGQVMRRVLMGLIDHIGGDELAEVLAAGNPNAASGAASVTGTQGAGVMVPGAVDGPGSPGLVSSGATTPVIR